jgi:ABC-type transport system involved in multi-copper enzyme maturation permease subunit
MMTNMWVECSKLCRRRDAQIGLMVFVVVPVFLILLLRYGEGVTFAGEKTALSLANSAISMILATWLGPMLIAVISAGSLAREQETGEMRLILSQPHRRYAVLSGKCLALGLYVALVVLAALVSGLFTGALTFGCKGGEVGMGSWAAHTWGGLLRTALLAWLGLTALAAIVLLLAVYAPFGATLVLALALLIVMSLLGRNEQWQPYLLTHLWNAAGLAALSETPSLLRTVLVLLLYWATGLGLAIALFERKDI